MHHSEGELFQPTATSHITEPLTLTLVSTWTAAHSGYFSH
jgi:hypothetical protein